MDFLFMHRTHVCNSTARPVKKQIRDLWTPRWFRTNKQRLPDSLKEMLKKFQKAFIPIPKPRHDLKLCKRWVNACCRQNFSVKKLDYNTYTCAVHRPGGKGPRKESPDPFKANLSEKEVRNKTQVKRKAPKQGHEALLKKARKQPKADSEVESPDVLPENDSPLYDFKDKELPTRDHSTQKLSNAELKSKIETPITSNDMKTGKVVYKTVSISSMSYENVIQDSQNGLTGLTSRQFKVLLLWIRYGIGAMVKIQNKSTLTNYQA